jgi:hypothetical protein
MVFVPSWLTKSFVRSNPHGSVIRLLFGLYVKVAGHERFKSLKICQDHQHGFLG